MNGVAKNGEGGARGVAAVGPDVVAPNGRRLRAMGAPLAHVRHGGGGERVRGRPTTVGERQQHRGSAMTAAASMKPDRGTLREERVYQHDRIDRAYWLFSRTARAKPPILVVPDAYARRAHLDRVLRGTEP